MNFSNGKENDSSSSKINLGIAEKEENEVSIGEVTQAVGAVAGVAFAVWGLFKLFGSQETEEKEEKMMKAPGTGGKVMPSRVFEDNPRAYFRELHGAQETDEKVERKTMKPPGGPPKQPLVSTLISWSKPARLQFKVNTDGSSISGSQKAGIGGVIRDFEGIVIGAFCEPIPFCSSMEAEITAAMNGLLLCEELVLSNIILEVDSMVVVDMVQNSTKIPWMYVDLVHQIQEKLYKLDGTIKHCFREGNFVADTLCREASEKGIRIRCYCISGLSRTAREYADKDREGVSSLRIISHKK